MDAQTPITDEIQGYGVLEDSVLAKLRIRELSGELTQIQATPILEQCRALSLRNQELEIENIALLNTMVSTLTDAVILEEKEAVMDIENMGNEDAEEEARALLNSITN